MDFTEQIYSGNAAQALPEAPPAGEARMLYPSKGAAETLPGNSPPPGVSSLAITFTVMLALCAGAYFILRRGRRFGGLAPGQRKLVVSESRSLGNRQFLVVVQFENERLLLGVTPGKIDYLCPLPVVNAPASSDFEDQLS